MAATTITLEVLKGAIPPACDEAGQSVIAAIVLVDGLVQLSLTISSVTTGSGDTDSVVFSYNDEVVPSGVNLAACNFASFQCVCDSCEEKRCFEIIGPDTPVVAEVVHVGFLPGNMIVDQIRFYSPTPNTSSPLEVSVKFNGYTVGSAVLTGSGFILDRTNFESDFTDGVFEEDGEFTLLISDAPIGDDAWQGLSLCLLGRWATV
jgi:hypothetical protein